MRIIYSHKCSIHQYYRPSLFHASCNTIRGTMATYQGTIAQLLVSILGKLSIAIFPFASRSRLITGTIKKSNIASAKCWQLKKKTVSRTFPHSNNSVCIFPCTVARSLCFNSLTVQTIAISIFIDWVSYIKYLHPI